MYVCLSCVVLYTDIAKSVSVRYRNHGTSSTWNLERLDSLAGEVDGNLRNSLSEGSLSRDSVQTSICVRPMTMARFGYTASSTAVLEGFEFEITTCRL